MRYNKVVLGIGALLAFACNQKSATRPAAPMPKVYFDTLQSTPFRLNIRGKIRQNHPKFREQITTLRDSLVLYYLTMEGDLVFQMLSGSGNRYVVTLDQFVTKQAANPLIAVKDSVIYSIVPEKGLILKIGLTPGFAINTVDSLKFQLPKALSENYIRPNIDQPITVAGNSLFIPIGSTSERKKFIDDHAYVKASLDQSPITFTKTIPSPAEFRDGDRRQLLTVLFNANAKTRCFFRDLDRVLLDDGKTGPGKELDFNPYASFTVYDYAQRRDLGYVRLYESLRETNEKILQSKRFTVIIKKLRSKSLHDEPAYEYLVLDADHKLKHFGQLPGNIAPYLTFLYDEGFVVIDKSPTDARYCKVP